MGDIGYGQNISTNPNPKPVLIDVQNDISQADLLATVAPAVVGVMATGNTYESIGTGVCVLENGYVLTNNHVVEDANNIKLYLSNGNTCKANILWSNVNMDLAVLKSEIDLPYLKMAEKNSFKVGDDVYAIGTPIALQFRHSATKGMISAINRTLEIETSNGDSTLANLIQHDASINPGNSGGPLINTKGEVLGINTAKIVDAEAMGFAIPIEVAKPIVSKLKTDGKFECGFLGVFGYDDGFNDYNSSKKGVYVLDVKADSPASKMQLKKGDIIKQINGEDLDNTLQLRAFIYASKQGEKVSIKYVRDNQEYEKSCYLDMKK